MPSWYVPITCLRTLLLGSCLTRRDVPRLAECPRVDLNDGNGEQLCAGRGVCDFDSSIGRPRCFCFQGHQGADCNSTPSEPSGLSTAGAALIAVSVILALVLVGL